MRAARLAGRAASTVSAGRSVSTRPVCRHLTFCEREIAAFASTAVSARPSLSRPRVASPHDAVSKRRVTALSHLSSCSPASTTLLHARTSLGPHRPRPGAMRARCLRAAEEVLRPFRRPTTIRKSLFPSCSRLRAKARIRAPNTSWSPLRGLRYGDTETCSPALRRGRASAFALLSLLSRREREAASPRDEVVSGCEDSSRRVAPRRIDTTRRIRGAVSSPPLWRAGPPRSLA
jgi:hypothetical protein